MVCPHDEDYPVVIRKTSQWTMIGNVFGEFHRTCTLMISFVDFGKGRRFVAATKDPIVHPCQTKHTSCSQTWLTHPLPYFYIIFVYYWTCSCPEYS